ncbi:hypothetical protein [Thiospirillum jenense]|uniref:Uncharacterized protein n=1 Tax=Thiospirillum jenense TaxID=1653858 RepID=A0A839H8U9_9GAMM|nr:hypothetical protein [Thiospirillum jenense]MBB1125511.1 hypothetical protein [Thiospirillum jenense]
MFDRLPRWTRLKLFLRRPRDDSRMESWRLDGDQSISVIETANKKEEYDYLASKAETSIAALNQKRASLGIIKPDDVTFCFDHIKQGEEYMMSFFKEEKPEQIKPRITFRDDDGKHSLQLRDWGAHEFLRKNPTHKHYMLWDALKLNNDLYQHLFFVGNHNQHRNIWLIIGIISIKIALQPDVFNHKPAQTAGFLL